MAFCCEDTRLLAHDISEEIFAIESKAGPRGLSEADAVLMRDLTAMFARLASGFCWLHAPDANDG